MSESSNSNQFEPVPCEDCEDPIPFERLKAVRTKVCVSCAMDREAQGTGVKKHKMYYDATVKGDDIEELEAHLVRDKNSTY